MINIPSKTVVLTLRIQSLYIFMRSCGGIWKWWE